MTMSLKEKLFTGFLAAAVTVGAGKVLSTGNTAFAGEPEAKTVAAQKKLPDIPNENLTKEFDPEKTRKENLKFAGRRAKAGSANRVSLIVYGGDNKILVTAYEAAQEYAARGCEVKFYWTLDKDRDPSTVDIVFFGNGIKTGTYRIRGSKDYLSIKAGVKLALWDAYNEEVAPK